jgi:hypothetical protein
MANVVDRHVIESGPKNAVVQIVGVLGSADVVLEAIVDAVETNPYYRDRVFTGYRVIEIEYSMGPGIQIQLAWGSSTPQLIAALAGRGEMDFEDVGGLRPDETLNDYDGTIRLSTTGFDFNDGRPQNFTVTLTLAKIYAR